MREDNVTQQGTTSDVKQIPTFEINVRNKFNEDKRNILVCHKDGKNETCYTVKYTESPVQKPQEQKFKLTPGDSLIIELGKEHNDFKWDVHVELPYVADYELYWEVGDSRVDRPVNRIIRDTKRKNNKQIDDARTVVVIPRDQGAWKLKIMSPGNLKEHYLPKNLLEKHLQMVTGESDDVSIGDNNDG